MSDAQPTIETTLNFTPHWDANGLMPAIAQDFRTGAVLMLAWMNAQSLEQTLATGRATYWSRSRNRLWIKGEESGHTQRVVEVRIDCDQDCLLLRVEQTGPACHTNAPECFYRVVQADGRLAKTPMQPSAFD